MSKGFIGVSLQRSQALHNPYVQLIFTLICTNGELIYKVENLTDELVQQVYKISDWMEPF